MRLSRLPTLALVILPTLVGTDAWGLGPARQEGWWAGLDSASDHAPARGTHALRPPLGGRVHVSGGSFTMGSSAGDLSRAVAFCHREVLRSVCDQSRQLFLVEAPAHEVTLSPFEIDRTEVTVAAYARCVSAGACTPPGFAPGDPRYDRPELPVTYVRWEDANVYCAWAGARLPTEAEWEFAARGTADRTFPWGDAYNPHLCNHGALADEPTDSTDGFAGLAPVGSFPDGATQLGILDLAGNASEWVWDLFDPADETGFGYPAASQINPKGPTTGVSHVVRGGSYLSGAPWVRSAARGEFQTPSTVANGRSPAIGFRCAADAGPG